MEIKLFGKSLFSFKSAKSEMLWTLGINERKVSKFLPDFYEKIGGASLLNYAVINEVVVNGEPVADVAPAKSKADHDKQHATPKSVYDLKMLNDQSFKLRTDDAYVDEQLAEFKEKLDILSDTNTESDMRNGVNEVASIILRLENRKKYGEHGAFFEQYPYTTTSRIAKVVESHDNLQIGTIAQFVADLPKEATAAIKAYNKATNELCGKQAVFYIIADKKDFKKSDQRKDPILLAQSPFGHFWQILGAWDKEMRFLEEL